MSTETPYMQTRCLACGAEIYALAVYDYSHGTAFCHVCGYVTEPMDKETYLKKLRERFDRPTNTDQG